MKRGYETDRELHITLCCLPALAMVPVEDVTEAFDILADNMPQHEKMPEMLSYFEHMYV